MAIYNIIIKNMYSKNNQLIKFLKDQIYASSDLEERHLYRTQLSLLEEDEDDVVHFIPRHVREEMAKPIKVKKMKRSKHRIKFDKEEPKKKKVKKQKAKKVQVKDSKTKILDSIKWNVDNINSYIADYNDQKEESEDEIPDLDWDIEFRYDKMVNYINNNIYDVKAFIIKLEQLSEGFLCKVDNKLNDMFQFIECQMSVF